MANKNDKSDTLQPERIMYAVQLGDDIISVEATSAQEAEAKAKAQKDKK